MFQDVLRAATNEVSVFGHMFANFKKGIEKQCIENRVIMYINQKNNTETN